MLKDPAVEEQFALMSDKIAEYALGYHKAIEASLPIKKEIQIPALLRTILFYPSRFMLKYNGVKRVKDLTTHFCIMVLASKYGLNPNHSSQNTELKTIFSEFHDAGDFAKLIFSITSSSLLAPVIYYIVTLFLSNVVFSSGTSLIIGFFGFIFVLAYNYIEYDRLRTSAIKDRYFQLKKEISELP